ncbi:zinc finger protein 525-like [Rhopalosiphum maidis]|uniref:zinc finger protein 525-like n=1 Tax=Rhopalosiphum maidis TaxID=43146 RepID=UPI000EFFCFA0|nr:zinc finger protein 525-like [Rhopalosiphum maidis]XP_026819616.1 zinc finger protein 525-like [Rhopalosiphum maidis]
MASTVGGRLVTLMYAPTSSVCALQRFLRRSAVRIPTNCAQSHMHLQPADHSLTKLRLGTPTIPAQKLGDDEWVSDANLGDESSETDYAEDTDDDGNNNDDDGDDDGDTGTDEQHKCIECGKWFRHRSWLKRHVYHVHLTLKHQCSYCPAAYNKKSTLVQHTQIHTGKKDSNVPIVMRTTLKKSILKIIGTLNTTRTNKQTFICPECETTLSCIRNLTYHMNVHNNVKPFQCDPCDESFF